MPINKAHSGEKQSTNRTELPQADIEDLQKLFIMVNKKGNNWLKNG